jgi:signal transduction histidine kinase
MYRLQHVLQEGVHMSEDFFRELLDISRQLAETRTLDPLLDYAMAVAMELFGAEYGYLILLQEDGSLDFRIKRNRRGAEPDRPEEQISQTILTEVIRMRKGLVVADALSDEDFQLAESVAYLRLRSVMCVPLISRERVLGVLYLENRTLADMFTEDALSALQVFASQAAVAIDNATLNEELEARVAVRTAELQTRNEELSAFAYIVAHDLKSPLSAMLGFARIVQREYDSLQEEKVKEYMQAILRGGRKMSNIIDELFLLASVREQDIPMGPLDMETIIIETRSRLAHMIEQYKAKINGPDTWPIVRGYAPWVEEVWANYLSNAIKYGGTPPHVELGADPVQEGMVRFWIRDDGAGLTEAEQVQLFTPFTQLARNRAEGQGLGLSIVRRIVEKLGGQVWVESKVGAGSTFGFTLPVASKER